MVTYIGNNEIMEFVGNRLNAMSDGIIAIIITVMVFSVPIPSTFQAYGIVALLYNIGVFFISFLIVGMQWIKHCNLFSVCDKINGKIIWFNILYLFTLSLMPLFTKWIMTNTEEVVPAIAYDIAFFMLTVCYHCLQNAVFKENRSEMLAEIKDKRNNKYDILLFASMIVVIIGILGFSFYFPTLSILFFVAAPIIPSFHYFNNNSDMKRRGIGRRDIKKN